MKALAYIGLFFFAFTIFIHAAAKKWDWEKIDTGVDKLCFKNSKNKDCQFLFGVSTSAYQVEGDGGATVKPHNQWIRMEKKEIVLDGKKEVPIPYSSGGVCEHWERYKEDIQLVQNCGFNSYSFSIDWGKVEPEKEKFNENALKHYENVCKELEKRGIKPVVVLYHYTHPCWFEDIGGFEKEENLKYFLEFCEVVFKRLRKYVAIWFTINSPSGYAIPSYYLAKKPPFKKDMQLALNVLKHMLEGHVKIYQNLKKIDKNAKIGICKTEFPIEPYHSWNPMDRISCKYIRNLNDDSFYDFFTKGLLKIWVPSKGSIYYENKDAIGTLDLIGINHFSGAYGKRGDIVARPECIKTQDEYYTIYPEGFYEVLHNVWSKMADELRMPIYIIANGISPNSEDDRDLFLRRYLYSLSKAINDGIDIRGYMYWTLLDDFEWTFGFSRNYGIYSVDFKTQKRTLKEGSKYLIEVAKKYGTSKERCDLAAKVVPKVLK